MAHHLSSQDRGIASAWAITCGLVVAAVAVHRLDIAGAGVALFLTTWTALTAIRARRAGAGARAARRAALEAQRDQAAEQWERTTAEWDRRRAAARLENVPGRPDDAGVIPGPPVDEFRALMRAAGAGDLERKTS